MASLPSAEVVAPRRRPLGFEIALVVLVSLVVLAPGIWSYSLVDPWETHYGEVSRAMLETHDYVHMDWPGSGSGTIGDNEGFRSKPILMFWMMAASMRALGIASEGGYSGELVASPITLVAIRLPFILAAIFGLVLMWWMLARLVNRRLAWLALLVVGSAPMFCLIARQAIPDMPLCATTIGALALFIMGVEDGDRAIVRRAFAFRGKTRFHYDARHVVFGIVIAFVGIQAVYDAVYFTLSPALAFRNAIPNPAIWLPALMLAFLCALHREGWLLVRLPFVLLGGIVAAIVNEPMPLRGERQSLWRHVVDDILLVWDRHAIDRYIVRGLVFPIAWADGGGWEATAGIADRILRIAPIRSMRQLYLISCYFLLGVSLLAKGPPGLAVVGGVGLAYLVLFVKWRDLYEGGFELKRGILMILVVSMPWHIGMYLKEGVRFKDEYLYTHILNRAAADPDHSLGTFEYYTSQLGHGMWIWAALLPAALAAAFLRANKTTREGRVRTIVALWAMMAVTVFAIVQTKFHHYILPAVPPLGILVAFFLDDIVARRDRLHPLFAAIGSGIVLLICRDLMFEPERWIEMFTFRYDRPWPAVDPYQIDPSDGFLALGVCAAIAIPIAATRFVRLGVTAVAAAGLAICVWALQVYMPLAGTHWGMRDAVRAYYEQRTIYGDKIVYFDSAQVAADWPTPEHGAFSWSFETFIPDTLQIQQPMTVKIQLVKPEDERVIEKEVTLVGAVTAIGDHDVRVTFQLGEYSKLQPILARPAAQKRVRAPVHAVDADRLIAWQLYWRGENFWSGGEIWGHQATARDVFPEMKTSFVKTDNVEFNKFIKDPLRAPIGRRYFIMTEASRITSVRALLPTQRARDSFEVIDTTSNKFSIAAFWM
jgi:4-amino-4-deoxy-L-arabinose transferase-like glycosyltransferase